MPTGADDVKRVLLLADSPYFGGVTSHLLSVMEAFRRREHGFAPVLATLPGLRDDETLLRLAREQGIDVHVFPMAGRGDVRILSRLSRFVRQNAIDLVHTHGYRATLLSTLSMRGVAKLNTCHGALVGESARARLWQWAEIQVMRRRPTVVACSDHVRQWLCAQGVEAARITVVRNAVALPDTVDRLSRESLGINSARVVVAYVGRLVPGKGLETLIAALSRLPEATGLIVGDGPLWGPLESMARVRGAKVRFLGAVRDPWPCYRLADVVVLPSEMEGLPMVLVEAAAAGKPSVACSVGGVPEVLHHGETGLLCEHGDVEGLYTSLRHLTDPEVRSRMGAHAHAFWRRSFTPERLGRELAAVYRHALNRDERGSECPVQ